MKRKTARGDQLMFLDESVRYKTGMEKDEEKTLLSHVNKEAIERQRAREYELMQEAAVKKFRQQQEAEAQARLAEQEEKKKKMEDTKQLVIDTGKQVKNHEIAFHAVNKKFKIAFAISILCFLTNCILSIIHHQMFWGNIINLFGVFITCFIMKHLTLSEETNDRDKQITQILKQNMSQVINDYITYKTPDIIKDHADAIIKASSTFAVIAFIIFPSHNVAYALSVVIAALSILLLIGMKEYSDLDDCLQRLNNAALIGVAVKAIVMICQRKFIQIEYMNIALLFLFTYIQFYFKEETTSDTEE